MGKGIRLQKQQAMKGLKKVAKQSALNNPVKKLATSLKNINGKANKGLKIVSRNIKRK